MKKRILSLLLIVSFMMSLGSFCVSANDFSDSWANKEISFLIEKGIVSGDEAGNVNPYLNIKRCEFIKVINKIMGYTKKAETNFSDVSSDKWYFEEFLIAKANNVINGDNSGNANPESYITREEAFKIIATILNLKEEADISFSDQSDISDWALTYIKRIYKSGLVKGYEDGSIKPLDSISREEAFYVFSSVYNIAKGTTDKSADTESLPQNNVIPPVSTGGGGSFGGGGSSGGTAVIPVIVSAPVITSVSDTVINFTKVSSAVKYIVNVSCDGFSKETEIGISLLSKDLKSEISEICEKISGKETADFLVTVTAENELGVKSAPSKSAVIKVDVDTMLSTADLGLSVDYKTVNSQRGFYVDWTDNTVSKIVVKCENGDREYLNPEKPLNITQDIVTDGFLYKIIATANIGKQAVNTSVADSYFEGGSGTESDPYLISEGYQFLNVAKNMSAHYLQIADITLDSTIEPLSVISGKEFSGTYKAKDGKKKITANVLYDGKYASLFGQVKDAEIKGIIADGTVTSAADYAGGIAGEIKNSLISDCENKMTVTSQGLYAGGIVGQAEGSTLTNVINSGTVTGESTVGGIAGQIVSVSLKKSSNSGNVSAVNDIVGGIVADVKTKKTDASYISECINSGNVSVTETTVSKQYAGGIAGKIMDKDATLTLCANKGNVTGTKYSVAGIVAYIQSADITKCYNSGKITGENYVSGIVVYAAEATVSVTDCMNTGDVTGTNLSSGILASATVAGVNVENCINLGKITGKTLYTYPIGDYKNVATLKNNYYLTPDTAYSNLSSGTTEINVAGWSVLSASKQLPPGFSSDVWEYVDLSSSNKFPLPQIKGNNLTDLSFATVNPGFNGGAGIKEIPFEIATKEQLAKISSYPDAYYILTEDIEGVTSMISSFGGYFDGNNHTITVNISEDADNVGLFAIATNATIKNLTVKGTVSGKGTVGGIIGKATAVTLSKCINKVNVSGTGRMIGGIAGSIAKPTSGKTVIENCVNNGEVTGGAASRYVAGIAGSNYDVNCEITLCANHGKVSTKEYYPAGIVSFVNNGMKISQCLNTGNIETVNGGAAGIVSQSSAGGVIITDCMNTGGITAGATIKTVLSGILALGHANDKVTTSFNMGNISGNSLYAYPIGKTGTYENNIYVTPETAYTTVSAGAVEIADPEWETMAAGAELPSGFSSDVWEYAEKTDYNNYPLLHLKHNNYYKTDGLKLSFKSPENLGSIIPSTSVSHGVFGKKDGDDILYTTVNGSPAVFNVYNITEETLISSHVMNNAKNVWCHLINPFNNNVYIIGTGNLYEYDVTLDLLTDLGDFSATEGASFTADCDENGNIYIGTSTNAKVIKYDIQEKKFVDLGTVKGGATYVRSLNYVDGYLYLGIKGDGYVEFYKVSTTDFSDKEQISLPGFGDYSQDIMNSVKWIYSGTVIGDKIALYVHTETKYILLVYDTVKEEFVQTGYDGGFKGLYTSPVKDKKSYFIGDRKLRYIDADTGIVYTTDISTGTDAVYGSAWLTKDGKDVLTFIDSSNGNLIYYDIDTGERWTDVNSRDLTTTFYQIQSLEAGDLNGGDNAIYLGSYAGASSVRYDLDNGNKLVFPTSQAEGMVAFNGKQYMGMYTKAGLYEFDYSKQAGNNNPLYLGKVGTNQDRPFAMCAGDGKVFLGTIPDYGYLGGEIGIYDTLSETLTSSGEVIENQSIMSLTYKDGFLYGSTTVWGGLSSTPDLTKKAKIFKYNPETNSIVWEFTPELNSVKDPLWIGSVAFDKNGKLWAVSGNTLFCVDVETKKVTDEIQFADYEFSKTQHQWRPVYIRFDETGNLYTNINSIQIVNVDDISDRINLQRIIGNKVYLFTLDKEGNIYYASSDKMYKLELK